MTGAAPDRQRARWWCLFAMGAVGGLIMLDESVIGVALPTLRHDLAMTRISSHWVVNAYLLVFTGFAAVGGKLCDLIGARTTLVTGLGIFALASLAAGFAQSGGWIIAARMVQGLGAAAIFPSALAMVTGAFPDHERGRAMGILAAITTMFLVAGPLVGGLFTEMLSWRWIFWINVPVVVLIVITLRAIDITPPLIRPHTRLDLPGLLALVSGLALIVFAVMQGAGWGWSRLVIWLPFAYGLLALAAFALIEHRSRQPLIDVDLFASRSFSAANLIVFAAQFSKITVVVFGALYLQEALQMSSLTAGVALLVAVAGFPVMAATAGRCADRFGGRWPALIGLAIAAAAMLWIGFASGSNSYLMLAPALAIWGGVLPFCFIPSQRIIMNSVAIEKQGEASGVLITVRLLGGTIGAAVGSTLLTATGSFALVFAATGALMGTVLVAGLLVKERQG